MTTASLPAGWSWASLDEVLERIETGKSFKCEERPPHDDETGVVKVSAVSWGEYDEEQSKTCTDSSRIDSKLFIAEGDFLFSRANTIELVGACVIARAVRKRIMLSDKILRLRLAPVEPRWMLYMLRSEYGRREIERLATGNQESMRNIGQERIRSIRVPLPPLAEQVRITDEIDQQLSRIEAGIEELQQAKRRLARYRASVLKAACEGRLVPTEAELARVEGRECDSALKFVERLADEAKSPTSRSSLRGPRGTPRLNRESPFGELPDSWAQARVGQLIREPICNGLSIKGSDEPPGVQALRLSAMNDRGFDYDDIRYLPIAWDRVRDLEVRDGDFFVSRGNGTLSLLGRGTLAQPTQAHVIFPDTVMRVRLGGPPSLRRWVARIWPSLLIRRQVESAAKTTAGIWKISQQDLAAIAVPIPPPSEQVRIVAEVDRRLSLADELAATINAALARAGRLRQSILKRAFEGKLVPQDPNDAPASVLLARIRKEREVAAESGPRMSSAKRARRARVSRYR